MAYSVNSKTKVATLDGVEYLPTAVHDGKELSFVALTEDECKFFKDLHATIPAQKLEYLRKIRNQKLAESDWTQTADSSLSDSKKAEWVTYRTALKDITKTYKSTEDDGFEWPKQPS